MSTTPPNELSPLKRALLALQDMRAQLDAAERTRREPIAVVGIGCRLPGGISDPDGFWRLLQAGADAVGEVPRERWDMDAYYDPDPDAPGKIITRRGGFIEAVDRFDAGFFGIAPREAQSMDPQQRLLLEVAWEALEHAGLAPDRLQGSRTGVFVGISNNEYFRLSLADVANIDAYLSTGNADSVAAGRLSYILGLHGPTIAIDTACSSSLVTVHLACQSLRLGECDLALAGGVNLILSPEVSINFSKANMLAPDGRCKTFDAAADGYVRGEGCALVALKRLSDAQRDGDHILAVIRGSAVNHDGRSNGLTAPNGPAQQAVIRQALQNAGVTPAQVSYVEAHGTGTSLGDPIELIALGAVLGQERPVDQPVLVGSVKTNLGHLETAAGVAGLIKLVLMLQHAEIPAHLHLRRPSPQIPWADLPLRVPTVALPWQVPEGTRRIAGISSFGFSGTNAHLVLEEPPAPMSLPEAPARPAHLLTLSARTPEALGQLAERLRARLAERPDAPLGWLAASSTTGRAHLAHRLAVVAHEPAGAAAALAAAARGEEAPGLLRGAASPFGPPEVVFLCTGQGAQYVGMGRELYATQPTFRAALDQCAELLLGELGTDIRPIMFGDNQEPRTQNQESTSQADRATSTVDLDQTALTQPALFCLGYALAQLWRAWGVEPAALLGHSVGELLAAHLAGVFSLEDALKLIAARGRLMQEHTRPGGMRSVSASAEWVQAALTPFAGQLSLAAVNGPSATVVAGEFAALEAFAAACAAQGVQTQALAVSHAFHSPLMDPMLDRFEQISQTVKYQQPNRTLISNLRGTVAGAEVQTAAYWREHARAPVRFAQGLQTLLDQGYRVFIELGPRPTLCGLGQRLAAEQGLDDAAWLPSLRSSRPDWTQLLESLAGLYVRGGTLDWAAFERPFPFRREALPTYPFQRQRFWIEGQAQPTDTTAVARRPAGSAAWYTLGWEPLPRTALAESAAGAWLLLGAADGLATTLAERLTALGGVCTQIGPEALPADAAGYAALLARYPALRGLVDLRALDDQRAGAPASAAALLERQSTLCAGVQHLLQALAGSVATAARLWIVTRGAQAATAGAPADLLQAALWGLGRVAALEQPEHWGGLIDLAPDAGREPAAALADELVAPDGEDQLALRDVRLVARLTPRADRHPAPQPIRIRPDASYLISGGLGALGLQLAAWLAERGARSIVLLGRRGLPASAAERDPELRARLAAVQTLEARGVRLRVLAADVADEAQMAAAWREIAALEQPLRGIIHAAGVTRVQPLAQADQATLAEVLRPKAVGAWLLDRLSRTSELDFFVCFSSIAAVWGSRGLGAYAAANHALDALAHQRRAEGLPALSINWGPWAGGGMMSAEDMRLLEQIGVAAFAPEQATAMLRDLLALDTAQVVVAQVDWARFQAVYAARGRRPLLDRLAAPATEPAAPAASSELRARLASTPAGERLDLLRQEVSTLVARVLGFAPEQSIDPRQGLFSLGLDSLMSIELRNRLEQRVGLRLPATMAFDYPTVEALARHLAETLLPGVPVQVTPAQAGPVDEPIAIVGLACRFPGADSPEQFWQLLREGRDAIGPVPRERWDADAYYDPDPDAPGKIVTRSGGFLEQVDRFDAELFGIAPREAVSMDPQQRLLLETSWEALERAGLAPDRLQGSRTGVFVGITTSDYARLQLEQGDPARLDAYFATGNALNAAAGRLAYSLGLQGPCMSVDTACSSSLVAIHLACQSLRGGESSLALAGGVNVILWPEGMVALSRARMLAPDGRCKTFDAAADGYGRGEGCGVLVLKRLSDAQRDGDPVLALIHASAVNQDGASGGLTVPNGPAQQALIRRALAAAGLEPTAIDYVEAHGTGTSLGDPIEINALAAALGQGRAPDQPLLVGSVKTNIGHLESAAGVAGLIKLVLSLQHGQIPPHLHFQQPSPHIAWDELPVAVPTAPRPWPVGARPRLAGLSSFGFSGTNAHLIVGEAPAKPAHEPRPARPGPQVLALSARSRAGLGALARRYEQALAGGLALADVCLNAGLGRAHFAHRLALVAESAEQARARLADFAAGSQPEGCFSGQASAPPKVAFLCTGQGAQYVGMGRALYATEPVFRAALDQCAELLLGELGTDIRPIMFGDNPEPRTQNPEPRTQNPESTSQAERTASTIDLDQTALTQPALFCLGYALAQMWRAWGVEPAALVGHSVGEVLAAHLAGVFSLEDALRLIAARGRLMQEHTRPGGMRSVSASAEWVQAALAPFADQLSLAAVNGPSATVVAGEFAALEAFAAVCAAQGVQTQALAVSHAFHSPLMDPMLDRFEQVSQTVKYATPTRTLISNLRGAVAGEEVQTAAYWREHARAPVRFAQGLQTLLDQGYRVFVELGPRPTLCGLGQRLAAETGVDDAVWLPSLRSSRPDPLQIRESLAGLYARGATLDWAAIAGQEARQRVELPTYPFQRQRFWFEPARNRRERGGAVRDGHPLIGRRLRLPMAREIRFETEFAADTPPYLTDHRLYGTVVTPAASHIAMVLAALRALSGADGCVLEDLFFPQALVLSDRERRVVQLVLTPEGERRWSFQLISAPEGDVDLPEAWSVHATGKASAQVPEAPAEPLDAPARAAAQERCATQIPGGQFYATFWDAGYTLGPAFQWLGQIWRRDGETLARMHAPPLAEDPASYQLYPGLIDSFFQLSSNCYRGRFSEITSGDSIYIPFRIARFAFYGRPGDQLWCHARLRDQAGTADAGTPVDIRLCDDQGRALAEVRGFESRRAGRDALMHGQARLRDWLYTLAWRPLAPVSAPLARVAWLILADRGGVGAALARRLAEQGLAARLVYADQAAALPPAAERIDPDDPAAPARLLARLRQEAQPPAEIVYLWGLDAHSDAAGSGAELVEIQRRACAGALHLAQALAAAGPQNTPRLRLVTRGAQAVEPDAAVVEPAQAALWGFGRTLAQEHPELRCACIDLDPAATPAAALEALLEELAAGTDEDQIGLRTGRRYGTRLVRLPAPAREATGAPGERPALRLVSSAPGILDNLSLQPTARRAPGAGEVEIAVGAAGLNFRDVLNALGMYPGDAGPLGGECAGTVVAVGPGVSEFAPGDAVLALAHGSLGSYVTLHSHTVAHKPANLSDAEAATIPAAFLTAAYALERLARLRPGEKVLIHAAAGGVGMAAVQLAQQLGAEVYATAGSPEKRARLQALGVRHVFSSRTLDFSQELRAASGERGVDVVLNSLSGEFIPASLDVLAPRGRFVEIGKIGIWDAAQVAAARPDVAYHVYALDALAYSDPAEVGAVLRELVARFGDGRLRPMPFRTFPLSEAAQAFRWMAQARHVGKIVLTQPERASATPVRPDGVYLISGGLGGLGLRAARWLVERGARHLALLGRNAPAPEAQALIDGWRAGGVRVHTLAVDVSDAARLARALAGLRADGVPLRGLIHAAGLLDDGVLAQQSWARFARVLAPKAAGAWNLHLLTRDDPLDFFVLYSSTAALLGNPGQSNYAAANATLDALAHARRAHGLPALSINWGAWREVGMAARQSEREQRRWAELGVEPIGPDEGLQALELLLAQPAAQAAVVPIQWARFMRRFGERTPALFAELAAPLPAQAEQAAAALTRQLAETPAPRRRALLVGFVREQLLKVLALSPDHPIDTRQGLTDLGLDSLMAMELRNRLQQSVGGALPPTLTFDYPTVEALAEYLLTEVLALGAPAAAPAAPPEAVPPAPALDPNESARLEQLSQDELVALLAEELAELDQRKAE